MLAELAENEPMHSLMSMLMSMIDCVIVFGCMKEKTGKKSCAQVRALSSFGLINKILGTEKPYLLIMWTKIGVTVSYQGWKYFCYVWMELE